MLSNQLPNKSSWIATKSRSEVKLPKRFVGPKLFRQQYCGRCRRGTAARRKQNSSIDQSILVVIDFFLKIAVSSDKIRREKKICFSAYRTRRIDIGSIKGDFHGVQWWFQNNRKLIKASRFRKVRIHCLEANDLIEAILQSQPVQYLNRMVSIGIGENLYKWERKGLQNWNHCIWSWIWKLLFELTIFLRAMLLRRLRSCESGLINSYGSLPCTKLIASRFC